VAASSERRIARRLGRARALLLILFTLGNRDFAVNAQRASAVTRSSDLKITESAKALLRRSPQTCKVIRGGSFLEKAVSHLKTMRHSHRLTHVARKNGKRRH